MKLQYQLSNGMWVDCGDRTEEFLSRCDIHSNAGKNGGRERVLLRLSEGKSLRNDPADWFSFCRYLDALTVKGAPAAPVHNETCSVCGRTGVRGSYPFSTRPGVCDDCA
jgi:hypothetical protein